MTQRKKESGKLEGERIEREGERKSGSKKGEKERKWEGERRFK